MERCNARIIRSKSKICFLRLSNWLPSAARHGRRSYQRTGQRLHRASLTRCPSAVTPSSFRSCFVRLVSSISEGRSRGLEYGVDWTRWPGLVLNVIGRPVEAVRFCHRSLLLLRWMLLRRYRARAFEALAAGRRAEVAAAHCTAPSQAWSGIAAAPVGRRLPCPRRP